MYFGTSRSGVTMYRKTSELEVMDEKPRRRFRFGLRTLFELIAVAAFILTLIYYRQPRADQQTGEMTGRYQLEAVETAP